MRVLLINHTCGIGSTGRICAEIAEKYRGEGHEAVVAYGRGVVPERYQENSHYFGSKLNLYSHVLYTRLTDNHGFASKRATREFLKWADAYDPDLLWLHNIHGYYINIEMLFAWIKSRPGMEVKWTLHDCWAFTGHCSYFTMVKCEQWKGHCSYCVQKREYPASVIMDHCQQNFERKRKAFTGVKNLTLITPSQWLADLVRQSFLQEYPVEVHYNRIDRNVFKPTPSDFRKRYGLEGKIIILGVANVWQESKGWNEFLALSEKLPDSVRIVMVGLTEQQQKQLPGQIVGIMRTSSVEELAGIYSAADIFLNPSQQETFGMTTVEALCCGVKYVIVYKGTACEEIVEQYGGIAVEQSFDALYTAVLQAIQSVENTGVAL